MSDLVCLNCGKEMEYDWAPCSNCGWKVPAPWEAEDEPEEHFPAREPLLAKPNPWIQITVRVLLAAVLAGFVSFIYHFFR